jgi:hypothetical protein
MPTTRPRHYVTETDDLAAALDVAAKRWPGLSRARLLVRLALSAADAEAQAQDALHKRRLAALERLASGDFAYPAGYLADLREDWPE